MTIYLAPRGAPLAYHAGRREAIAPDDVAVGVKQPTRGRAGPHSPPIWPCSRWGLAVAVSPQATGRSYRPISTLPPAFPWPFMERPMDFLAGGGMFLCHFPSPGATVKLPRKPGGYPAPCPEEPGLSSPARFPPPRRSPGSARPLQAQSSIPPRGGQGRFIPTETQGWRRGEGLVVPPGTVIPSGSRGIPATPSKPHSLHKPTPPVIPSVSPRIPATPSSRHPFHKQTPPVIPSGSRGIPATPSKRHSLHKPTPPVIPSRSPGIPATPSKLHSLDMPTPPVIPSVSRGIPTTPSKRHSLHKPTYPVIPSVSRGIPTVRENRHCYP